MYDVPDRPEFKSVRARLNAVATGIRNLDFESQIDSWRAQLDGLSVSDSETDAPVVRNVARAYIFLAIGQLQMEVYEDANAIATLTSALEEASAAQDPMQQYLALHCLGLCYLSLCNYSEAVRYLQMSLRFANHASHLDAVNTLSLVAMCWQKDPGSVLNAAALYDWVSVLQPNSIPTHIEKYRCLIAGGSDESVIRDAAIGASSEFLVLVKCVAANAALKKTRVACRVAREAWRLADAAGDETWRNAFGSFLSKCTGGVEAARTAKDVLRLSQDSPPLAEE